MSGQSKFASGEGLDENDGLVEKKCSGCRKIKMIVPGHVCQVCTERLKKNRDLDGVAKV
ncbi:MAG: hypothetical protein Hyperionvirus19_15 [Hyperionvirus sp.]|uniref:Uncharacterized protein n=1 Tax=Hyperionvirus sp. TaxID=2487770 RepID=A0A3G5AD49_9VIRU|nr:MAG: hypothetical protein Hyperionvirus19_15 [Hyperionvirus sp.]